MLFNPRSIKLSLLTNVNGQKRFNVSAELILFVACDSCYRGATEESLEILVEKATCSYRESSHVETGPENCQRC
jgi:hypothetical protein